MISKKDAKRYVGNIQDEADSFFLYHKLADIENRPEMTEIYKKLAASEEKHILFWEEKLTSSGVKLPGRKPSWRAKVMAFLAGHLGAEYLVEQMNRNEKEGAASYSGQPEALGTSLKADEESHRRTLEAVLTDGVANPVERISRREKWHKTGGNALRAAVMGSNDGLVSNLSLVMGVAGANLPGHTILLTGFAGLLAGACSMALGEWLSVQSSRELYANQVRMEKEEVLMNPAEEAEELSLIYQAKGFNEAEARKMAGVLLENAEKASDTLAREELGIDPEELGGSAIAAALTSFGLFAVGAIIPVFPFLFLTGYTAVLASLGFSAGGLYITGAAITLYTGKPVFFSGGRQLLLGLLAAAVTFGIGKLIGAVLV